jgi:hypothetical protein
MAPKMKPPQTGKVELYEQPPAAEENTNPPTETLVETPAGYLPESMALELQAVAQQTPARIPPGFVEVAGDRTPRVTLNPTAFDKLPEDAISLNEVLRTLNIPAKWLQVWATTHLIRLYRHSVPNKGQPPSIRFVLSRTELIKLLENSCFFQHNPEAEKRLRAVPDAQ